MNKPCPFDRGVGSRSGGFIMVGSASCTVDCRHNGKSDNDDYVLCGLASECEYCNDSENFLLQDVFYEPDSYFDKNGNREYSSSEFHSVNIIVIIDRGYLRIVDEDETNDLHFGEKIKINYCPMCGEKI